MAQKIYESLKEATEGFEGKDVFLVRGGNSFIVSGAAKVFKELGGVRHFYDFETNPKLEDVRRGIRLYNRKNWDLVVAIGGGSAIDMAKLIRGLSGSSDLVGDIKGGRFEGETGTKFVAVPTTAGSGSESTPFAVVYIDGVKYSYANDSLLADEVVLDWELTRSMSAKQAAVSGMDALSQAIESYWSINSTEESRACASRAMGLVINNLEMSVNHPSGKSRRKMLWGANWAGQAIAISKTTACHSISYPITSRFGVPHGHAVALTLGEMFDYNCGVGKGDCTDERGVEYVRRMMGDIGRLTGGGGGDFRAKLEGLMRRIGLETRLSELGIRDYEVIVAEGFNPERMKNNPRRVGEGELRRILDNIY